MGFTKAADSKAEENPANKKLSVMIKNMVYDPTKSDKKKLSGLIYVSYYDSYIKEKIPFRVKDGTATLLEPTLGRRMQRTADSLGLAGGRNKTLRHRRSSSYIKLLDAILDEPLLPEWVV